MTNNTQNQTSQNQKKNFFDLHTSGVGYLNRARTVSPNSGDDYVSVSIAALRGNSDKPSYTYFDTIIVGADALAFVQENMDTINDRNHKVLVHFKVGDGEPTSYEVKSGDNKGKRNHIIKSRLLQITWASINGDTVHRSPAHVELELNAETDDSSADENQKMDDQQNAESKQKPSSPGIINPDELGFVLKLRLDDPNFEGKRKNLEASGYGFARLDGNHQVWEFDKTSSLDEAGVFDDDIPF